MTCFPQVGKKKKCDVGIRRRIGKLVGEDKNG